MVAPNRENFRGNFKGALFGCFVLGTAFNRLIILIGCRFDVVCANFRLVPAWLLDIVPIALFFIWFFLFIFVELFCFVRLSSLPQFSSLF